MKRLLFLVAFFSLLLTAQVSFAENKLTQPVIDLLRANKFAIKFTITSKVNSTAIDKDAMKYAKDHDLHTVDTLVFDGQNALTVSEGYGSYPELKMYGLSEKQSSSFATLFSNGESYSIISKGKGLLYNAAFEPNVKNIQQITHYTGANNAQGKMAFEAIYRQLIFYFLPLLPELNSSTDLQGNEVKLNYCTVFSKIGEVNFGNQKYQYEEYKTPDDFVSPMTTRYYFKDGKLVKIIQIAKRKEVDADADWKNAFGTEAVKLGHMGIVEILEITDTFNHDCLLIPKGIKIMDFASPY